MRLGVVDSSLRWAFPVDEAQDFFADVIDVNEVDRWSGFVDLDRLIAGDGLAPSGDDGVVIGAAPFAIDVIKTVNVYGVARFLFEGEDLVFRHLFASSVGVVFLGLGGAGEEQRDFSSAAFQLIQERFGEIDVPIQKLLFLQRPIDSGQMNDEIGIRKEFSQIRNCVALVEFKRGVPVFN